MHVVLFPTGTSTTLGVTDLDSSNKTISFYPNPVKSVLNFSEKVSDIKIKDLTGRTVKQTLAPTQLLDVASFENGIYIVTATTKGGNTITKKLIKE